MPESTRASFTLENELSLESMDLSMDDHDPANEGMLESRLNLSRDSAKSIESLNTLLMSMPEISIPPLVHNPLPLQCLAASALPIELKREIDVVIAECAQSASSSDEDRDICCRQTQQLQEEPASILSEAELAIGKGLTGNIAVARSSLEDVDFASINEQGSLEEDCCSVEPVEIEWTVLKRQPNQNDDLGVGLKIMGGVKCDRCCRLHAVVTSIYTSSGELHHDIKEGVCIAKWGEQSLDGHSFEGVQRILLADTDSAEVKVGFMKCSDNLLSSRRGRALSVNFTPTGTNGVRNVTSTLQEEDYPDGGNNGEAGSSLDFSKRNSLPVAPVSVGADGGIDSSLPKRPTSLEVPSGHTQRSLEREGRQQRSSSRSPSPAPNGERKANIKVPKLDFAAQALLAAMEARPKSPRLAEDLQQIFDQLPSGMMQLSIRHNADLADLSISLSQVKGQSLSDVFINTYLIPDIRQQGVRSVKVTNSSSRNGSTESAIESQAVAYMITENELSSVSLRVILWDAKKSKSMTFRGEVLLGLSDDIVNLGGDPTWYNVCPVDPNLPRLPLPVHYKSKASVSVEQLLNRFKSNFSTLKFKSSRSVMSNLELSASDSTVSLPALMKRRRSVPRDRLLATKSTRAGSFSSQYDNGPLGEGGTDGEEETKAQVMKLATILKVLKDSAESDDAQSADDALEADNKQVKKTKLRSILRVLRETTPGSSSESGDNLDECTESTDGDQYLFPPLDDGTFSTLDRRVRKRKQQQRNSTLNPDKSLRPKSDSFNTIPTLRSSLSCRGRTKVPTFSFLEERNGSVRLQTQRESSIEEITDSMDEDERSDASYAEHYRLVDQCNSDNEQEPHPPSLPIKYEEESNRADPDPTLLPAATVAMTTAKPSDCSCYPVEVSLHRISIVDVDRQEVEREKRRKTMSLPSPTRKKNRSLKLNLTATPEIVRRKSAKGRSRSLGDMEDLESEEELILVRSPFTPGVELDRGSRHDLDVVVPFPSGEERVSRDDDTMIHEQLDVDERRESFAVSSLDFSEQPRTRPVHTLVRVDEKEERGEKIVSDKGDWNMSKWRSLDNLLTGTLPRKTKKNKKKHLAMKASLNRMNSVPSERGSSGNVELELQYNDLNPLHPVLLVKLIDVVFFSSKGLISEFTMKSYIYHRSSKVCILKNKANVNMKAVLPSAPLGLVQFETDITHLSLQVCLFTNSKLFSRKLIGEVWIDLDSLSLSRDTTHTEWYSLNRQTIQS